MKIDEPIAINGVKRFITDVLLERGRKLPVPKVGPGNGKKIAVVGSGPSGLSCAFYLQKKGYEVTVFEEARIVGGMLVLGLPAYRLPRDKFEKELDVYRAMGVKFQTGTKLGRDLTITGLAEKGFLKIYLALGARADQEMTGKAEGHADVVIDPARTAKGLELAAIPGYRWESGSLSTGPDSVVGAVSRGKLAAASIDRSLGGDGQVIGVKENKRKSQEPFVVEPCPGNRYGAPGGELTEDLMLLETGRCLRCDLLKVHRL